MPWRSDFRITDGGCAVPPKAADSTYRAAALPDEGLEETLVRRAADLPARAGGAPTPAPGDERASDIAEADSAPTAELTALLEPMLDAIVRLAGASAGIVRVLHAEGECAEPVVAVGVPGIATRAGARALAAWCDACPESREPASECVQSALCGHDERFAIDVLGPVCKHVVAVPLRHGGRPVGTVDLLFASEHRLSPAMAPLLQAIGDLVGMTLDNARLARENLRIRLGNERQLLANEVHDALAQALTYMRMRMSLMRDAIRRADEAKAEKYWNDVDETLDNSQRRLRELITYFRSRMDPQGLLHALTETSERFLDRTGIALEFDNRVPDLCVAPEREIEIFHIVQEALANICRHAHAKHARLVLARDGDRYVITIEDDGVGLAAYPPPRDRDEPGHYGIAIMQERARHLGGSLSATSAAQGTRIELHFPARAPLE
jgi:two-component system nitrate/nitrite sensor histidine kinase NarX